METLYEGLLAYTRQDIYPFHMPGHKRNPTFQPPALLGMDITEIPGADNLNHPDGVLRRLQERFAHLLGAEESLFTVNGSTCGNLAAITAVCGGGKLIMARNAHRSAYGALALTDVQPVYVQPCLTPYGFCGGVPASAVISALDANPDACAVFITSPTYEGIVSDVPAIANAAHARGIPLVVDEAHGAHFALHAAFPKGALACGADIVIHSLHKTLPFLSQTALLHMQGKLVNRERVRQMLSILQTSSPSYLLMAQADYALSRLERDGGALLEAYVEGLNGFRREAALLSGIRLLQKDWIAASEPTARAKNERFERSPLQAQHHDLDPGKLVFLTPDSLPGAVFEDKLLSVYKLQLEMSGQRHAIAMTSPADTPEGFARLQAALHAIDKTIDNPVHTSVTSINAPLGKAACTIRQALRLPTENVPLTEAENRIAAAFLIPYPPGIPAAAPGERLSPAVLSHIRLCVQNSIPVLGLGHTLNTLPVLRRGAEKEIVL